MVGVVGIVMKEQQIKEIIEAVFIDTPYFLFEIKIRGTNSMPVIEVFADTEDGIAVKECSQLCREIGERLDESESVPEKYRLDVSSPGIDREFKYGWQYKRNVGRNISVEYLDGEETKEIAGDLEAVKEDKIVLRNSKEIYEISFNQIKTAKVKTKW